MQGSIKWQRKSQDPRKRSIFKERVISLSPDNINEAKAIVEELKKQNIIRTLQKNPLTDINSIKAIQNSPFFQLDVPRAGVMTAKRELDVTLEDIETAFAIISPQDKGKRITAQEFASKMGFLTSLIPDFDAKVLMNNRNEMTSEELVTLLRQIEQPETDTVEVVFQALDRKNEHRVDLKYVCELMERFGIETFGEKDFDFLLECMDADNDGSVGLEDLRRFLERDVPPAPKGA